MPLDRIDRGDEDESDVDMLKLLLSNSLCLFLLLGYINQGVFWRKSPRMSVTMDLGVLGV
jgi:hypothetical protein